MEAIDLFAGLGGFTEAARLAGIPVKWAANHEPAAVASHMKNHPEVEHVCQDLHQADWTRVPAFDLMLASPCCHGHTRARGKERPVHERSRSTAWAVVSCAEYHRPSFLAIENVADFMNWVLYPAWEAAMTALGYTLSPHVIDAADYRVPQNRERVYIVGTRSRKPLKLKLAKHDPLPIAPIIEWDRHNWSPVEKEGRASATLARVKAGRKQFGDRFVMPYYSSGSGLTGRSLTRPIGTITTIDRWAVVDGDRMRMLHRNEARAAMGFREDYQIPDNHRLAMMQLGNAVCPPPVADLLTELKRAA